MMLQDAFDLAARKARYGHKEWIVWRGQDGGGNAGMCTAENVQKALVCLEPDGRFWRISASTAAGIIVKQRMGELMLLRNCLRSLDGPAVRS